MSRTEKIHYYGWKIKRSLRRSESDQGRSPGPGRSHGAAAVDIPLGGGGGSLHVVEPELLLHVTIRHLAKGLLVVLHELEDGRQLLFLNSVEKKGYRGERCSYPRCDRERERCREPPGGSDPPLTYFCICFPEQGENQTQTRPTQNTGAGSV